MEPNEPQPVMIDVHVQESRRIVRLVGELDMAAAPACSEALHAIQHQGPYEVVIDLRGLTFLDSMGLSALLGAHLAGLDGHTPVSFVRGGPTVHRVFQLTQMDVRLDWVDPSD